MIFDRFFRFFSEKTNESGKSPLATRAEPVKKTEYTVDSFYIIEYPGESDFKNQIITLWIPNPCWTHARPVKFPWKQLKILGFFMGLRGFRLVNFCSVFFAPRTSQDRSEVSKFNNCIWHPHEPWHHVILYCMIDFNLRLIIREKQLEIKYTGTVFFPEYTCIPEVQGSSYRQQYTCFLNKIPRLEQSFQNEHFLVHVTRSFFNGEVRGSFGSKGRGAGHRNPSASAPAVPKSPWPKTIFRPRAEEVGDALVATVMFCFCPGICKTRPTAKNRTEVFGLTNLD